MRGSQKKALPRFFYFMGKWHPKFEWRGKNEKTLSNFDALIKNDCIKC